MGKSTSKEEYEMKKFIIMGLTLSAFALVSCGKSEKEKCEEDDKKEWKDGKCADKTAAADGSTPAAKTYTIANKLAEDVDVSSGEASVSVKQNNCVSVKDSQWAALKVDGLCDNSDKPAEGANEEEAKKNDCPEAGNYNVAKEADSNKLVKADTAAENCAELKKEETPAANTGGTGTTTAGGTTGSSTSGTTTGGTTGNSGSGGE